MIYLDNSATTRPYEEVSALTAREEQLHFANASSLYKIGLDAEDHILAAKKEIASVLHCTPNEVHITSGGTYGNNLAVLGSARARKRLGNRVVLTKVEHPSVYACGAVLEAEGFEVIYADPTEQGLEQAVNEKTVTVAVMMVNNETGSRLPVEKVASIIRMKGAPAHFHIDAVQAFCKLPISVNQLKCDTLSVSAHKIKGPKGIGALYVKKGTRLTNITVGGQQEGGLIPGTYNSPAAAGFTLAVQRYRKEDPAHFEALRAHFLKRAAELPFLQINSPADGVPYILNCSVKGYLGENVLHFLEMKEIYVSQGSACSSKKSRKESVLGRLGADEPTVMGALRFSFAPETTLEELDALIEALKEVPDKIQRKYKVV